MSYNGSGTFNINTAGQPVVTGTVISSTAFNALTSDLGTGLSTAITKDGQTVATARIPFAQGINSSLVTDATNTTTGSIITAGGVGIAKALFVGTTANIAGTTTLAGVTATSITDSGLTSGRVTYAGTAGLLQDSANLTFNGTTLTANTIGAFTLGGTVAGGGNQLNNVVIGTTTPLAGAFTTLTASSTLTVTGAGSIEGLTVGRGGGAVATNTAVGASALAANTGAENVAVGQGAMSTNTTGNTNTAIGRLALNLNTTGIENLAAGAQSLQKNSSGRHNTASGAYALLENTTGYYNTASGVSALQNNTTASQNTAVGYQSGYTNTTGDQNTSVGNQSLFANTTGNLNTALGANALYSNTTGASNTATGLSSLYSNTTGGFNVAVGRSSLFSNTTASDNTAVGYQAGNAATGAANVFIGKGTSPAANSDSNEIVIGCAATGKGSSTGFINPNSGGVYQGNNSTLWSVTSDQRLKKNIVDNNIGLEKIVAIRVRNFEYRLPEEVDAELKPSDAIKKEGVQLGVIAQELQAVLPDCVKTESTGVMSVNSDALMWHIINAIKEISAKVAALENK